VGILVLKILYHFTGVEASNIDIAWRECRNGKPFGKRATQYRISILDMEGVLYFDRYQTQALRSPNTVNQNI